jgi:alkylated DNA repair dioxygenase AlkB
MNSDKVEQLFFGFDGERKLLAVPQTELLSMVDADVIFYRDYFCKEESDKLLHELLRGIEWKQDSIKYYGKEMDLPRLTAWYGDFDTSYTYSNIAMKSSEWTPTLLYVKEKVEEVAGVEFNSVLLNLYRNGKDSVSWHRDNEPELGKNPVIASVSFGDKRRFQFKHISKKELGRVDVDLTHGSLLIMKGSTQEFWLHQIPKTSKLVNPRVNLTFRRILK